MNNNTVIVTAGLSDYKLKTKIIGLTQNRHIESIFLIRKNPLEKTKKIINVTPPNFIKNITLFYEIWRFFIIIKLCKSHNIKAIIGIQLVAHGIVAVASGKLMKRHCIACPIGDDIHIHLESSIYSPFIKYCIKNADMLAYMGPKSKDILKEQNVTDEKLIRLNNYHDPDLFTISNNINSYNWDLIFIGDLIKRKNVDLLIRAINIVKQKNPNIKLAIVGEGEEISKLLRLRNSLKLEYNIEFLGYKNNIAKYLHESHIFVLVSKIEAIPAAAIEAMHCAIPPLLSNICDIPGIFKNNYNAVLIPPNNLEALVTAIDQLLNDKALYKKLRNGCIETRENYQKAWCVNKQVENWNKLLKIKL